MPQPRSTISIGELSARSGVATSALRFYEQLGLIESVRTPANHRRYPRAVLRRVSIIRAAQAVGLSLEEIGVALGALDGSAAPGPAEWERMSQAWLARLEERIERLALLRDSLTSCIGCGCLSMDVCALFNPDDRAARRGTGPRFLLGDTADSLNGDHAAAATD